jgi:flagellar motor component MotA
MERQDQISVQVEHAREVERVLRCLGWSVGALGIIGVVGFIILWVIGELDVDQAISLILGTALATILSGATAYGSGVNVGLGATRLTIAAKEAGVTRS